MKAKFYANIRTVIGIPSLDVHDAHVNTFRKLVDYLLQEYPEARPHLLDSDDQLRKDVPVYVDGRNPRLASVGLDAPLKSDAVVSFFSPISSGRMNVEMLRDPNLRKRSSQ